MKTIFALIVMACGTLTGYAENDAEKALAWVKKGKALEKAGDPAGAIAAYKTALQLDPKSADAQFYLGEAKAKGDKIKLSAIEAKFGTIKIPVYNIEEATIQESLELLAVAIEKQTNGETVANFIVEDPDKKLAESKVTLKLKEVPVSAILGYIQAQTLTKIRYDEHAIVVLAR